jgi:hypothetical protein
VPPIGVPACNAFGIADGGQGTDKSKSHTILSLSAGRQVVRVPRKGVEPLWYCYRGILSPVRLPVPPSRPYLYQSR